MAQVAEAHRGRAFLPAMYARGSGGMLNNASVMGWRAGAMQSHYAAAKGRGDGLHPLRGHGGRPLWNGQTRSGRA